MATIVNPKNGGTNTGVAKIVEDVVTDTGTVQKGFRSAAFYNAGAAAATVNGETLQVGVSKTYPWTGYSYQDEIAYVATGTTLNILVIY